MDTLSKSDGKKEIKNQIARAVKSLINEKRFSKITVGNICEKSGLSRQSFYRNFYDKYDVLAYLFKLFLNEAINNYGMLAMTEIGEVGLEFFCEYKNVIKDMGCDFGYPNPFMNFWFDYCYEHYCSVIGKHRISAELESAMRFYFHATYFTFYEYVCGNIESGSSETIKIVLSLMPETLKKELYKSS